MQSTFDERIWLAWLVKVRILILTFLLGIQLTVAELTPTRLPLRLFLSTIVLWYTVSLFYVLLLSFWQEHRLQASLQVLTDLIMVSLVVHETGGWDSSFNFLYPLAIIVAGILLPRIWAYLVAALAFILYGTVLELNYYGLVRSYCTTHPELKALQGIIFVNLFAFLAIAYLASQLVAKLRQQRVDHHRSRWPHYSGQQRRPETSREYSRPVVGKTSHTTISRCAAQWRVANPRRGSLRYDNHLSQDGSCKSRRLERAGARSAGLRLCAG